ncbi:MAG: protein kinase domain-containing protein [Bryobacteraceae bacterium]
MSPPSSIAHYRIVSKLGEGGMGAVYRATDTKLNRDVAIKILPPAFAEDPGRMARFEREAQVLASLNHPNIAAIYGIEQGAIIMELVEGEDLKGPVPIETALDYARQIAAGLEAAHEKGVVHRDLKPANIKVTGPASGHPGVVKLLDFGLAKATESAPASSSTQSPTLSLAMTQVGTILGTAAYMSPEQARGKPVDKRADIWAYGVVLYEMLTGRQLFGGGETVSDTLAAVLKSDPDWSALPAATPPRVRRLIERCLRKNPKQRLRDIGDARLTLDEAEPEPVAAAPSPRRAWLPWAVVGVMMVASAAVAVWGWLRPAPERPVVRVATSMAVRNLPGALAISPDGSRIAFVSGTGTGLIYVRAMDQLEAKPIAGTEGASFLSFSPDGSQISFVDSRPSPNVLKKVAIAGGVVQTLAPIGNQRTGPHQSWASGGNILFIDNGVLMGIPSTGGKPVVLARPDIEKSEVFYYSGQLLPGGREILLSVFGGQTGNPIIALDPQTGAKKRLLVTPTAAIAQFVPAGAPATAGYLVYYVASTGSLMAAPFDAERLEIKGDPVPVIDGVLGYTTSPFAFFAISNSGTLVYVPGTVAQSSGNTLVWVDRQGAEEPLAAPPQSYRSARVSPADANRIALGILSNGSSDIWVYDTARGILDRISNDGFSFGPIWTPDGKGIVYERNPGSGHPAAMWAPADRSAPPSAIATRREKGPIAPSSVSSDGKLVLGYYPLEKGLWAAPLEGFANGGSSKGAGPRSILESEFAKWTPDLSPDGHWVAYSADDTGRQEIYVTAYSDAGPKVTISADGGTLPRWSRNGRELFYRSGNKMMAVEVQTVPTFRAGRPKVLFEAAYRGYDVSADGHRFLMVKPPAAQQSPPASDQVMIVFNWLEELRRRLPAGK